MIRIFVEIHKNTDLFCYYSVIEMNIKIKVMVS